MIRFIHTADIHFGLENYGKIDAKTGIHTRLLDFEKALNFCIDRAIKENVDFFLFAGDAYKTHNPSQTQQKMLFKCFLRLYSAGIPIVIVIGNHDHPLSFGKAHALDMLGEIPLEGFHVFAKPGTITLQTKNGPINIVGVPWPTRNTIAIANHHLDKSMTQLTEYISKAVAHIIADYAKKIDPTIPAVLASHITVNTGIFSGSEKRAIYGNDPMLMPSQLAIAPFDYVALGHLHRHQNLNSSGYPAVVYSGSIERIDFGERKQRMNLFKDQHDHLSKLMLRLNQEYLKQNKFLMLSTNMIFRTPLSKLFIRSLRAKKIRLI
jgi:DNA repair protein SbcD/Mre11